MKSLPFTRLALLFAALVCFAQVSNAFRVGFVYNGGIQDFGWTFSHDQARIAVQDAIPSVDTTYIESIKDEDAATAIQTLIDDNCDMIFTCSFGFMDATFAFAQNHPSKFFVHISGYKTRANMASAFGKIHQARYLAGLLAGNSTATNKVGYIAAFPIPEVYAGINAFAIGIRETNPSAQLLVTWIYTWEDPELERAAALRLIAAGCDALSQHVDTRTVQLVAKEKGIVSFGSNSDQRVFVGESVLTSALFNWGPAYTSLVNAAINGSWQSNTAYYRGFEDDIVRIATLSNRVSRSRRAVIQAKVTQLKMGNDTIFCGAPVAAMSPNGNGCLNDSQILAMSDYVPGVSTFSSLSRADITVYSYVDMSDGIAIFFMSVAAVAILLSAVAVLVIFLYKDRKAVKAASPLFLIFIVFGVILSCVSVFFWGGKPSENNCMARTWLGGIGFIFIFGSLIVKTWRISRIFSSQKVKSIRVPDSLLVSIVAVMMAVEFVILAVWQGVSPLKDEVSSTDFSATTGVLTVTLQCGSDHMRAFIAAFFSYKAALLLAGVVLAFRVKDIHDDKFNESSKIVFAVYNTFIITVIVVPLIASIPGATPETIYTLAVVAILIYSIAAGLALCLPPVFVTATNADATSETNLPSSKKPNHHSEVGLDMVRTSKTTNKGKDASTGESSGNQTEHPTEG